MAAKMRCPSCGFMLREEGDDKAAMGEYRVYDAKAGSRILECLACGYTDRIGRWEDHEAGLLRPSPKPAVGVDIHGVLDTYEVFKTVCAALVANGHPVHIMTGAQRDVARQHLADAGVCEGKHYSHLYSISDDLLARGIPVVWKADNPKFADADWDSAKARYCAAHGITALFDDSPVYGTYMGAQTEFVHIGTRITRN